ncbi:MAG: primosomal protein N', partial [Mahellales bacterium]
MNLYASIVIISSSSHLDNIFTYRVPQQLISTVRPGVRVQVPFGPRNGKKEGYVVKVDREIEPGLLKKGVKDITAVLDPWSVFTPKALDLA